MDIEVKDFIEKYIDLIEHRDWEKLYNRWYDEAFGTIGTDAARVQELNNSLEQVNIATNNETVAIRKQIVYDKINEIIQEWVNDIDFWEGTANYLPTTYVSNKMLCSWLGLDFYTIQKMIDASATHNGLIRDKFSDGYIFNKN